MPDRVTIFVVLILWLFCTDLHAQDKSKPEPDVIVFPNGEKLIGHFESVTGGSAKFKSDTVGEVTIDLSKVQELHSSQKLAVIKKDVRLGKGEVDGQIPRGTISVANQKVEVDPGNGQPVQTMAVADVGNIVDDASFEQALRRPGIFQAWTGQVALGASIVEATQNSLSFNTTAGLVRAVPSASWLTPRNRTVLDFSDSYGKVTQPGDPTLRTSIYHADGERDEYFTPQVYILAGIAFDHNFSQGLNLQQTYGGGFGWTVIKNANQTLDLKGTVNYEKQAFDVLEQDQHLINSIFTEMYTRKFAHSILLKEQATANPAWTSVRDYSTYASVSLTFPLYKRFGFNVNVIDSFLNDPPPGFNKNSLQFTTNISYSLP
jgi:hypothetical protein